MSYQPKTIIQLSEDKEILASAKSYAESIDNIDNEAMACNAFLAGVQSREVYIGNLHDNIRELIERFNKLDAEFIEFKKLHGLALAEDK